MSRPTPSPLERYLREVDEHAYVLCRESRHDLRSRIWLHVAEKAGGQRDEHTIAAALAELGDPEDLVAEELDRSGRAPNPFRARDIAPLHLLGSAVLTAGVGAVVGLALLWRSGVWPRVHKIVATVLVVGCTPSLLAIDGLRFGWALWLGATVVGAMGAAVYLLVIRLLARVRRTEIPPSEDADPPPTAGGTGRSAGKTSDSLSCAAAPSSGTEDLRTEKEAR